MLAKQTLREDRKRSYGHEENNTLGSLCMLRVRAEYSSDNRVDLIH